MVSPLSPPEAPLSEPSEIDRSKRRSWIIQLAPSKGRDTIENYIEVFRRPYVNDGVARIEVRHPNKIYLRSTSRMDSQAAQDYLGRLLGKQLRIHTTDARVFVGEFKCTDNECNVILSQASEYRHPLKKSISSVAKGGLPTVHEEETEQPMTSRFMGLIVVPGQHITKIELQDR